MSGNHILVTLKDFSSKIYDILKSDRDVVIAVGGFTGEGKSCFSTKLSKDYAGVSGSYWDFDRMTWSRKEMMLWIDGKPNSEAEGNGLKPGQLPEYSAINPDELFYMFYKRTWYEQGQIEAVSTFNTCRDRHLMVIGNVPDFWDLDAGFIKRIRFYVYIYERGRAWVFQQENNPFTKDPWNVNENKKEFRKKGKPYHLSNFLFEIHFTDWDADEKLRYYEIRNDKRVKALNEVTQQKERYKDIKDQRDNVIIEWHDDRKKLAEAISVSNPSDFKENLGQWLKPLTHQIIADVVGISHDAVRFILQGR